MAQITDLTWQQIESAATGITNLVFVDATHGVCLRVSALLANAVANKSGIGVVEFLHELRNIAAVAQESANENAIIGERLAAFPPSSSGTVINGYVIQSGAIVVKTPLATSGIVGANN